MKEGVQAGAYDLIIQRIRTIVAAEHGITLSSVCLLETRTVPKTTSGKIARSWCRKAFLDGTLKVLARFDSIVDETYEIDELNRVANDLKMGDEGQAVDPPDSRLSSEELRALSVDEIKSRLETMLVRISRQTGIALSSPLDASSPISSLGLDSLTLVQYNGVLQKKFFCVLPDEYLFSQHATLNELAHAVKHGGMTSEQKQFMEEGEKEGRRAAPEAPKSPLCPWFVCCY